MHLGVLLALYVLPMLFLTIWPARILTPARVGVLLLTDVVIGCRLGRRICGRDFWLAPDSQQCADHRGVCG